VDLISAAFSSCASVDIGVIEDDYLAITRQPEDVTVEVAKKLSGEFLVVRSINNKRGGLEHWDLLGGVALLEH
jgi:predicted aspartyl protease